MRDAFSLVSKRSDAICNFIEGTDYWGGGVKLIYRHYATLYFIVAVDDSESELGILDLIQVFVEALDKCDSGALMRAVVGTAATVPSSDRLCRLRCAVPFPRCRCFANVCELDLIFHTDRIHLILDEIVMGGMVLETSLKEILKAVNGSNKYQRDTQSAAEQKTTVIGRRQS